MGGEGGGFFKLLMVLKPETCRGLIRSKINLQKLIPGQPTGQQMPQMPQKKVWVSVSGYNSPDHQGAPRVATAVADRKSKKSFSPDVDEDKSKSGLKVGCL